MSDTQPEPKKHRHDKNYTVMIVSGDSDAEIRRFHFSQKKAQAVMIGAFALLLVLVCFVVSALTYFSTSRKQLREQAEQIASLREENAALTKEKTELDTEIGQLSVTLHNSLTELQGLHEADALARTPNGFPISTTATMEQAVDDPNTLEDPVTVEPGDDGTEGDDAEGDDAEDGAEGDGAEDGADTQVPQGNPIILFRAESGARVITSGAGTVTSVGTDVKYGNIVTVDHGNGYVSIYRNAGDPLVKTGDELRRGDTLFLIDGNNGRVGYQLQQDGDYIDPSSIMEING